MDTTILIVDDEEPVRTMAAKILQQFNYETLQAQDGQQGLEVASRHNCDVVLTDMKMPNMGGLDMAQELLATDPDRPVIIMTAFGDLSTARKALKIGVYDYLTKPFNIADVCASIERAVGFRKLTLEVKAYQRNLEHKVKERTAQLHHKVTELEARDSILRDLLSSIPPQEVLQKALSKTVALNVATLAVLYQLINGELTIVSQHNLPKNTDIHLSPSPFHTIIQNVFQSGTPFWSTDLDTSRKNLNLSSVVLLPIHRSNEIIAVIEIGKSDVNIPLGEQTIQAMENFTPYVAMALHECQLQQNLSDWEDNIENLLEASEQWSNLKL